MKSKLICRMLMLTLIVASIGVFSSCKDYDEDRYAEFNGKLSDEATLREGVNQQLILLQGRVTDLETFKNGLQATLDKYVLKTDFNTYKQEVADSITSLRTRIESLENSQRILTSTINRVDSGMKKNSENIDSLFRYANRLNEAIIQSSAMAKQALELAKNDSIRLDNLILAWGDSLKTAYENAAYAKAKADANAIYLHKLDSAFMNCKDSISNVTKGLQDSIDAVRKLANDNLTKANQYTDNAITLAKNALLDTINVKIGALTTAYKDADKILQDQIDNLKKDIKDVNKKIDDIAKAINARFTDALNKLVTGIIVQATDNQVFGTLALPLDIRSNVLMAYYGYSTVATRNFPSAGTSFTANADAANCFTSKDLQTIGAAPMSIANGATLFDNTSGNAGTLYLTVNPTSVDFSKTACQLVNSQDVASGITLDGLVKSDKTLTFGYTRAADNGFYETPATLKEENIDKVKVDIDANLKSTLGEVIKNKGKNINYSNLLTQVYEQFNGILPANGVKYAWTDSLGKHAVYSQYNIAATAFKPLSFKFLEGKSLAKLPTITPLSEMTAFTMNDINFDYKLNIDKGVVEIRLDSIHISADSIYLHINMPYKGHTDALGNTTFEYKDTLIELSDLKHFAKNLDTNLNGVLHNWEGEIQSQVDKLVADINDKVNAMMKSIGADVNKSLQDVIAEVNTQVRDKFNGYIKTANKYITRINSLANRLNAYLTDPNHYLQVCLLYESTADGAYHPLSSSKTYPTIFTTNGGGTAQVLLPTTYTAEIVVPAYKKFVAVTNVFMNGTSAQDGDATCLAILKSANNAQSFMNTVIPGKRLSVGLYFDSKAKAGCIYEITYSALDYSGVSSTHKYYVEVQ